MLMMVGLRSLFNLEIFQNDGNTQDQIAAFDEYGSFSTAIHPVFAYSNNTWEWERENGNG